MLTSHVLIPYFEQRKKLYILFFGSAVDKFGSRKEFVSQGNVRENVNLD